MIKMALLLCIVVFLPLTPPAYANDHGFNLRLQANTISVDAEDITLRALLEKLSEQRGIRIKGEEQLLDTRISVHFKDLPLEEGLKKALSPVNYSLTFDQNRNITGIHILGRSKSSRAGISAEPASSLENPVSLETGRKPFHAIPHMAPPDNPDVEQIDTTIIENSPPPENPEAQRIDTSVKRNCPPPGVVKDGAHVKKKPGL